MTAGKKQKVGFLRDIGILVAGIAVVAALLLVFPERRAVMKETALQYTVEMIQVLPAVPVLMGLFAVWVTAEQVERYLGKASGLRGAAIALLLGSMPTGPLYVAFPVARGLLSKGASTVNVMILLSAWACIKIPQALVELRFLGLEFMVVRIGLTTVYVVLMAHLIDALVRGKEKRAAKSERGNDLVSDKNRI